MFYNNKWNKDKKFDITYFDDRTVYKLKMNINLQII